jgi:hypothetical protein
MTGVLMAATKAVAVAAAAERSEAKALTMSVSVVASVSVANMIKVTNKIREAAAKLLSQYRGESGHDKTMRERLAAIADGKRKLIDAAWWRKAHGDIDRAKLDKIAALADPTRNTSEHERRVAANKLAAVEARRPPGIRPEPPPLPREWKRKTKTKTPPFQQSSRQLSDSVAAEDMADSVAPAGRSDKLRALNEKRAAVRAAKRTGLRCQTCGKPLAARRATAQYCNATCRSQAWRASYGALK